MKEETAIEFVENAGGGVVSKNILTGKGKTKWLIREQSVDKVDNGWRCDCDERIGVEINSIKLFKELKEFFQEQIDQGIFVEVPVEIPHYIGYGINGNAIKWYANKWYRCKCCGTLWEFDYPDFPAKGFVRKFEDGIYHPKD